MEIAASLVKMYAADQDVGVITKQLLSSTPNLSVLTSILLYLSHD
jgi:hypothetical protein